MYKVFSMAVAIAIMPLSQKVSTGVFTINTERQVFIFPYKNTITNDPFSPEKNSTEAWSKNWMVSAQENIRKTEYNFKWEEKYNAYCTPNRKNNLRFFYNDKGFTVEPRTTHIPFGEFDPMARPDEIKYKNISNWKVKFKLDKKQVGKGAWAITENKAEYITDKITVQYLNNKEGVRQNFIVHAPLSKSNELKINFNIKTKLRTIVSSNRLQFFHKKTNVLNYDRLKVWDATGKSLEASIKKNKRNRFYIQVDTKEAVFPITVDPISSTPSAILESNQANARMGFSVASAGDVNGDGYSDVVVGVLAYDSPETDEGAAFVYHGSATGVSTTPATIVESNQVNARMGISVAGAGDVNGDGYSDIIVGVPFYDNAETDEGAAFVYHGSAAGINTTVAAIVESNQAGAQLGYSVACAGDVNGDGFSDVIVGAWLYDNPEVNEGAAFIYHGSASGISTTAATLVESNQAASNFGISVAGAGDVNGDGYSDIIVGAEDYDSGQIDEGVVFIYHGSAAGINSTAIVLLEENLTLSQFGFSVSSAGDVNGDGYSDVIVGAYTFTNGQVNEGVAFIYHGSVAGISNIFSALLECNQVAASFGVSVACAGDVNGDGYSDVIVGANQYDNGESNEGAAFVYQGAAAGINTTPIAVLESNQDNADMGRGVGAAGDVNGDGYSDVIVGAQQYDNPETNEGAAFVYHGAANGIGSMATTMMESNQTNAFLGSDVAAAGDINGDGYGDIVVGADTYDNGQIDEGVAFVFLGSLNGISNIPAALLEMNQANAYFGISVSSAGDVNADGYDDIIVGAYGYDNGETNEGAAFVYHGSSSGISVIPVATIESNQNYAQMAYVSSAGDVNGDGFGDVIVGAFQYDNGETDEGAAFVYNGSSTGVITIASATLEYNQPFALMGCSVASAGDVNGDGFGDVIVGAYNYTNGQASEGATFIFYGSATGVISSPSVILESNQADAWFGTSVAGAGDVNGDGYSDIIIGAPFFDNGQVDEGAVFLYHGSAAGINVGPAAIIEYNQAGAFMGGSVASAGDVNGDGYSDIIIGAYLFANGQVNEGAAFIYQGSVGGISVLPTTIIESNLANAFMGASVSTAGDVNGDGYSDVVIGAYGFTNAQNNEGAFFVYHGNSPGVGKKNSLHMYNTDLMTPINSANFILGNFGAGLYAKSFLGKVKGKLVWETRLNYNTYSGNPITNSTFFTAEQSTYSDLGLTGVELKNLVDKLLGSSRYTKLRARVKYDPVTAISGQVYGPWRNVSAIIDGNSLGALPVELISFKAAWLQKGKTVQLNFTTDKENGICCFEIEKSSDGFNFTIIGILAARNTAGIQQYNFVDNNATGKNLFYRLKIKGINGKIEFSNIQQLQNNSTREILVFPNPTTNVLQLQLNGAYNKINVQIINSGGQLVKQLILPVSNQTISIPVQNLAAGQYWLKLQSGDEKQVLQFIKP